MPKLSELYDDTRRLAAEAGRLVLHLKSGAPHQPTFLQLGIVDGESIIEEYLDAGELGCAVHHLLFVVHEADIPFPQCGVRRLYAIADAIGEPNSYSEASLSVRPAPSGPVFNRLVPRTED